MLAWDHSRDWVILRQFNEVARVVIEFGQSKPTNGELLAIRKCVPQYRDAPVSELRAMMGDEGSLSLGVMPTREARALVESAGNLGLSIVAKDASYVSLLPYDRTASLAWLIDDEAEAQSTAEAMIAAGVPIQDLEA